MGNREQAMGKSKQIRSSVPITPSREPIPQLSLGVFREHVVLQVHAVSRLEVAEVRLLKGVGDDPESETILPERGHGEADPVDGDRTFFDEIMRPGIGKRCLLYTSDAADE